jgi:hypothetical protein
MIRDGALAPGTLLDLAVGQEVVATVENLAAVGDTASGSRPGAAYLWEEAAVRLLTIPRCNQRDRTAAGMAPTHRQLRASSETVDDQLREQFRIEEKCAHRF